MKKAWIYKAEEIKSLSLVIPTYSVCSLITRMAFKQTPVFEIGQLTELIKSQLIEANLDC